MKQDTIRSTEQATPVVGSGVEGKRPISVPSASQSRTSGDVVQYNTTSVADKKAGRWKHPDTELSQTVANLVFAGMTQDTIARLCRVSVETLHEHYKYELDTGQAAVVGNIAQSLAQRALAGSDTAAIFLLKARGGGRFNDRQSIELTGKDGGPIEIAARTEILGNVNTLLRKGITIDGETEPLD